MRGFSAFRDEETLDFDGVDFFALVGPTGSGKSSVIDAICFALYGCVPRYEDRRAVAPAITMGAREARVSLHFDVGSERFVAARVVQRLAKGGATTKEARLERLLAEGRTEVLAGNADEVTDKVTALLGLNFEHFTRCVVLPQGEFARFLHDKPSTRQDLLVSLLDIAIYGRMGQTARQIADVGKNRIALNQDRLGKLAFATEQAMIKAAERLGGLKALKGEIEEATPGIKELEGEALRLRREAEEASRFVTLLAAVEVPNAVRQFSEILLALEAQLEATSTRAAELEDRRKRLEGEVKDLPDITVLEAAAVAHRRMDALSSKVADLTSELVDATAHEEEAQAVASQAQIQLAAAKSALDGLRREHLAVDLAEHLQAGEPCPVCLQNVSVLPKHIKPKALTVAESAVRRLEQTKSDADSTLQKASNRTAGLRASLRQVDEQRQELTGQILDYPDPAALAASTVQVRARQASLDAARQEEDEARKAQRRAEKAMTEARASKTKEEQAFDDNRDSLASLGPPKPGRIDLLADWTELVNWSGKEQKRQEDLAESRAAAATERLVARDKVLARLVESCREHEVEVDVADSLADIRDRVVTQTADTENTIASIEAAMQEAAETRADIALVTEEVQVAEMLAGHLKATGFERWLVSEALGLLVGGASEILRQLSGRQYSLICDARNEFLVIDHRNADEVRSAKTLSGGETFQASLALALALSDQLAGMAASGAARLEATFLDEGFGTLDPETLATVADKVEALGSQDRMVGIVTHVRELAERVPVRFEVTKDARTSKVERRTA